MPDRVLSINYFTFLLCIPIQQQWRSPVVPSHTCMIGNDPDNLARVTGWGFPAALFSASDMQSAQQARCRQI